MSFRILQLIDDIKSGRPVGIIRPQAPAPGVQLMYGRKDGVTMDQHLAEFDDYKDSQGRSFDQVILDGLFAKPEEPPKPQGVRSAKGKGSEANMDDDEAYMNSLHHKKLKMYMVENPLYRAYAQQMAIAGSTKGKAKANTSGTHAQSARVSKTNNMQKMSSTTLAVVENNSARKRPRTNVYSKK
jgi:hypothetical protein